MEHVQKQQCDLHPTIIIQRSVSVIPWLPHKGVCRLLSGAARLNEPAMAKRHWPELIYGTQPHLLVMAYHVQPGVQPLVTINQFTLIHRSLGKHRTQCFRTDYLMLMFAHLFNRVNIKCLIYISVLMKSQS